MATIATLTYSNNLQVIFDAYNERYEGAYPNLRYKTDVRFKYVGAFRINTNNTVTLGKLQTTISRSDTTDVYDSDWYYLGEINEDMGCTRQQSFTWNCSNVGYPNVSGQASLTTPLIELPTYEASVRDIDNNSITVTGKITNNPYGLYTLRLFDGSSYVLNNFNDDFVLSSLSANTKYTYYAQVFLIDLSGKCLAQMELSATTLVNYQAVSVKAVDFLITHGDTDSVKFTVHSSNDSNVQSTSWSSDGSTWTNVTGNTYTLSGLETNYDGSYFVKVIDTLDRESDVFKFSFHTTYTKIEAWVFNGIEWKRGYSFVLDDARIHKPCRLYYYTGSEWKGSIPFK